MALAALHDWEIEALDVQTTYLFGLKQSALQWNKTLHKSLLEMGFRRCKVDPRTYYKIIGEEIITLLIYVDDALFMGSNKTQVLAHKAQFMK
jgi:hypothetical protein